MKLKRGSFLFFVGCLILNNHSSLFTMEEAEIEITKKQKIEDPLVAAIENNDANAIAKAVQDGADPNRKLIAHNPLAWALQHNNSKLIVILLVYDANPMITLDPGNITFTALIDSLQNLSTRQKKYFKELVFRARDRQFLFLAASGLKFTDVARKLLDDYPQIIGPGPTGSTLLHRAAKGANSEAIKILAAYGADINAKDNHNKTALIKLLESSASAQNKIQALKILLSFGPTLQYNYNKIMTDPNTGQPVTINIPVSPLHYTKDPEILSLLLEHGADINFKDVDDNTLFHKAAEDLNIATLNFLLEHYPAIDVNIKNSKNQNALLTLFSHEYFHELQETSMEALLKILETFLKAGLDVNAQDNNGNTLLHYAVKNIDFDSGLKFIDLLKKAGANVDIQNNDGETPFQFIPSVLQNLNASITSRLSE